MRRDGKPDTHNTACMTDCVQEVRLSSEMPDYARDQHGNLAEQGRGVGTAARAEPRPAAAKSGLDLAKAAACTACHGVSEKLVGPGFREVATRYAGDAGAESRLVAKVKAGSAGAWGDDPDAGAAAGQGRRRAHRRPVDPGGREIGPGIAGSNLPRERRWR